MFAQFTDIYYTWIYNDKTKGFFSTAELQRQLGHKQYQPIWEIVNKLRDVMGKCDDEYKLE